MIATLEGSANVRIITVQTEAGSPRTNTSVTYTTDVQQFESLAEAVELVAGGEESVLKVVNAAQKQGATQGNKTPIRKAIEAAGGETDGDDVLKAVGKHQEACAKFIIGAPRGSSTGVTKKDREALGTAAVEFMQEHGRMPDTSEMDVIAGELGLTLPTATDDEE